MTTDDVKAFGKEQYWRGRYEALEEVRRMLLDSDIRHDAALRDVGDMAVYAAAEVDKAAKS